MTVGGGGSAILMDKLPTYIWEVRSGLPVRRRVLGGLPLKSIDQWFEQQAEQEVADFSAELVG
jgi:hypothetical protein